MNAEKRGFSLFFISEISVHLRPNSDFELLPIKSIL